MFDILYEDDQVIVIDKPPGVPVQTSNLRMPDMVSEIKKYFVANGKEPYVGLVTRLDQPVGGVIAFGKNKKATDCLASQIRDKSAGKEYIARVTWDFDKEPLKAEDTGDLLDYLLRDGRTNTSKVVGKNTPGAKHAHLSYKVIEAGDDEALVRVFLDTGRHHQIRVQFANAGYPLVGDKKYGSEKCKGMTKNVCLACVLFSFRHPVTGKEMIFETEPNFS
ncbi:MAG: RluA family pseudouridine synthase [Lachnospiraceae bacterium]|nr:RluA family pseudouridine synthase [Lachnospiraceae bacterium]